MNLEPIRQFVVNHRLPLAIIAAILVAFVITVVNVSLYVRSGASRLDLSRPGYEAVRKDVETVANDDSFSATGPVNPGVIDEFQELYSKKRSTLQKLDPFSPTVIDNDSIRLIDSQPAAN